MGAVSGGNIQAIVTAIADAPSRVSATHSCLLVGVHDVFTTAAETITKMQGLAAMVSRPYFCTILPYSGASGWASEQETVRLAINTSMKETFANVFDAEETMGDGGSPVALKAEYDFGDGQHLNAAGKNALAVAWHADGVSKGYWP